MIHDENEYIFLHQDLLGKPTPSEHARADRIASQMDYNLPNSSADPLVQSKLLKRKQQTTTVIPIIIRYTHEQRFNHYKPMIHRNWNDLFHHTPVTDTKLIVGTKNNLNLTKELVRRSPSTLNPTINHKNAPNKKTIH
jgi:hypothetical protein